MKPIYERELKAWSLQNSGETYQSTSPEFPVQLYFENQWHQAKIKVRGDLSRHWKEDKRSYRIKMKDSSIYGLDEFDLIIPADKGFELEAVAYEIAKKMGLSVPDYYYIDFQLNHKKFQRYLMLERWSDLSFVRRGIVGSAVIGEHNAWLDSVQMKEKSHYKNLFRKMEDNNPLAFFHHIYQPTTRSVASMLAMERFEELLKSKKLEDMLELDLVAKWMALAIYLGGEHLTLGDNCRWLYVGETRKFSPIVYDVLYFPVQVQKDKCVIDYYLSKNMVIKKLQGRREFYSKVITWHRWLSDRSNVDFYEIWKSIENKFDLADWPEEEMAVRSQVKEIVDNNIQTAKRLRLDESCR